MTTIDSKNSDQDWSWPPSIDPDKMLQHIDKINLLITGVFYDGSCSTTLNSLADDLMTLVYSPDYGD